MKYRARIQVRVKMWTGEESETPVTYIGVAWALAKWCKWIEQGWPSVVVTDRGSGLKGCGDARL